MEFTPQIRKHFNLLWLLGGLAVSTVSLTNSYADIDPVDATEDASFTAEQTSVAAKSFVFEQQIVLDEVMQIAEALEVKKAELLPKLGRERIKIIKEENLDLTDPRFENLDLDSPEAVIAVGEMVYEEQAIRGGAFALALGVDVPGLGKAKPTSVDGIVFPRVVHAPTGIAFLFLPDAINLESKHLKMYSARIANQANRGVGRPYVYLHLGTDNIEVGESVKYQFHDQPKTWKEKLSTKFRAHYVMPDAGAFMLTGISVFLQCTAAAGISYANYYLGNATKIDFTTAYTSAAFGTVLGIFASTYNNMTRPGDPMDEGSRRISRIRKGVVSLAFAYSIYYLKHNGDLSHLSLATWGGWVDQLGLWANTYLSSHIGDKTTRIYLDAREEMGLSRGVTNIAGVKIKNTQLDDVKISQIPRAVRLVGLLDPHLSIGSVALPFGNIIMLGYSVIGQWSVMKYLESVNYRGAPELREKWENFWGPFFRGIKQQTIDTFAKMNPDNLLPTASNLAIGSLYQTGKVVFTKKNALSIIQSIRAGTTKVLDSCEGVLSGKTVTAAEEDAKPPFQPSLNGEWMESTI